MTDPDKEPEEMTVVFWTGIDSIEPHAWGQVIVSGRGQLYPSTKEMPLSVVFSIDDVDAITDGRLRDALNESMEDEP